jgi:hypothetical protein
LEDKRKKLKPQFPQPEVKELEYIEMVLSEDSLNFPQVEGTKGSEGNSI